MLHRLCKNKIFYFLFILRIGFISLYALGPDNLIRPTQTIRLFSIAACICILFQQVSPSHTNHQYILKGLTSQLDLGILRRRATGKRFDLISSVSENVFPLNRWKMSWRNLPNEIQGSKHETLVITWGSVYTVIAPNALPAPSSVIFVLHWLVR